MWHGRKNLSVLLPEFVSLSAQATGQIELMVQLAGLRGFVGNPSAKEELVVEKTFSALVVNRWGDDKDPDDAEGGHNFKNDNSETQCGAQPAAL